jgi:hypothetical protein
MTEKGKELMTAKMEAKKILVLLGSPRKKGNSATLANQIIVGANLVGMVYGSADKPGEIQSNTALMQQAEALGKKLVGRASRHV